MPERGFGQFTLFLGEQASLVGKFSGPLWVDNPVESVVGLGRFRHPNINSGNNNISEARCSSGKHVRIIWIYGQAHGWYAMQLIVLGRDGVINPDSEHGIKSPEEWTPLPGSLEAIARLNRADYHVVVATNQSGIASGLFDIEALHAIHGKMDRLLSQVGGQVDGLFFCPHAPKDRCSCRKPKPGLFQQITERLHVDLLGVLSVGDSLADLQAAQAVGAMPILVRTGKGCRTLKTQEVPEETPVFDDLSHFVDTLLSNGLPT